MSKSTRTPAAGKPAKPRPDFPLFPHATGRWAKKVRGKLAYFGKVADDPKGQAALQKWLDQKDDLLAGRTPRKTGDGLTVMDLANRFLSIRLTAVTAGELSPRTFRDYHPVCQRVIDTFGKNRLVADLGAEDFEVLRARIARDFGLTARKVEIQRVRCLFRYADDAGLIDRPVRFGPTFKAPSNRAMQQQRRAKGPRMFEPAEIRAMLAAGNPVMRAMILLGVNCGFGNTDVALLPFSAVDLQHGWVNFRRPKTGSDRRCPLWSETVAALQEVVASRKAPRDKADAELVFITHHGKRFVRIQHRRKSAKTMADDEDAGSALAKAAWIDSVGFNMQKLLKLLDIKGPGRSFYALRHCFETIGGGTKDQVATDAIMGHSRGDMASVYRERIDDDRLRAVTDHVHDWLFPVAEVKKAK